MASNLPLNAHAHAHARPLHSRSGTPASASPDAARAGSLAGDVPSAYHSPSPAPPPPSSAMGPSPPPPPPPPLPPALPPRADTSAPDAPPAPASAGSPEAAHLLPLPSSGAPAGPRSKAPLASSSSRSLLPLSERAQSKQPTLAPSWSLEELRADVIHETENLISLRDIVVRLANYVYETFLNLGETMGSLSGEERRKRIFDTILDARRQLAKLLVVVIWASKARAALQTRDLIGLVNEQFNQANMVIENLKATHKSLPAARVRHYDVLSAVDVLNTGNYTLAPASATGLPPDPPLLSEQEQLAILDDLSRAIRLRLACHEDLPAELAQYSVQDGKALLRAPGLFVAEVTLSGEEPSDRWYLLSVEFPLVVKGPGATRFSSKPNQIQRAHILAQADAILTPRFEEGDKEQEGQPNAEDLGKEPNTPSGPGTTRPSPASVPGASGAPVAPLASDTPGGASVPPDSSSTDAAVPDSDPTPPCDRRALLRLFLYLRQAALLHQLEILHYQAMHLASREWGINLEVRWIPGKSLELSYWTQRRRPASKVSRTRPEPEASKHNALSPGSLLLTLPPTPEHFPSAQDQLLSPPLVSRINALWSAPGLGISQSHAITSDSLDLQSTLREITGLHARRALEALVQTCYAGDGSDTPGVCIHHGFQRRQVARLPLPAGMALELSLSSISGSLSAAVVEAGSGADRVWLSGSQGGYSALLAPLGERLRIDPSRLLPSWQTIAVEVRLQDLEQRVAFAGLESLRTLPLSEPSWAQLDPTLQSNYLFVPLPRGRGSYLVLASSRTLTRAGLLVTVPSTSDPAGVGGGAAGTALIQSIHWLDRAQLSAHLSPEAGAPRSAAQTSSGSTFGAATEQPDGTYLGTEEIRLLYDYAVVVAAYARIEQQTGMYHARCSYVRTKGLRLGSSLGPDEPRPTKLNEQMENLIPSLSIEVRPLLPEMGQWVRPSLLVRVINEGRGPMCFALCWTQEMGFPTDRVLVSPEGVEVLYDRASRRMTLCTRQWDKAVEHVKLVTMRISRLAPLVRAIAVLQSKKDTMPHLRLLETGLQHVKFLYAERAVATVRWDTMHTPTDSGGEARSSSHGPASGVSVRSNRADWSYHLDLGRLPHPRHPHSPPERNPHLWTRYFIEEYLNHPSANKMAPVHWLRFLRLMRDTFPLLDTLQTLQAAHCDTKEHVPLFDVDALGVSHVLVTFGLKRALDLRLIAHSRLLITDSFRSSPHSDQYPVLGCSMHAACSPLPRFEMLLQEACKRARTALPGSTREGKTLINLREGVLCPAQEPVARVVLREVVLGVLAQDAES